MKLVPTWSGDGHIHARGYGKGSVDGQAAARSIVEQRRLVEETLLQGASVARAHGVNANEVFYRRKLYQAGPLSTSNVVQLLPVQVTAESRLAKISRKPFPSTPIGCSPTCIRV